MKKSLIFLFTILMNILPLYSMEKHDLLDSVPLEIKENIAIFTFDNECSEYPFKLRKLMNNVLVLRLINQEWQNVIENAHFLKIIFINFFKSALTDNDGKKPNYSLQRIMEKAKSLKRKASSISELIKTKNKESNLWSKISSLLKSILNEIKLNFAVRDAISRLALRTARELCLKAKNPPGSLSVRGPTGKLWHVGLLHYILELKKSKKLITAEARCLIECVINLSSSTVDEKDRYGRTPLICATQNRDKKIVKFFINAGSTINAKDESGKTALIYASIEGDKKIVELLIDVRANINAKDSNGNTPLMCAAYNNHKEIVEFLINAGADVNAKDNDGEPALINLVRRSGFNDNAIVEKLLIAGADVNTRDNNGWTALMYASYYGEKEMVEILLTAGADVKIKNLRQNTALTLAFQQEKEEIISLLLCAGADFSPESEFQCKLF